MALSSSRHSFLAVFVGLLLLAAGLVGCESESPPESYVARVGDQHLTQEQLDRMMEGMGSTPDTTEARQQVIEQWVTQTLLYREALRLNLEQVPEVQRKLEKQRQSTLTSSMTNRIYDEAEIAPSQEEVRTYFERHKDQLQLREPYVRVRYLAAATPSEAQTVRRELLSRGSSMPDSVWTQLIHEHAEDPKSAQSISDRFLPEDRLLAYLPQFQNRLSSLREGEVTPVVENDSQYHVLHLDRRVSEGAEPELAWLEDEIRQRLKIRSRKQMYTREVQRLRNEARANDELEIP